MTPPEVERLEEVAFAAWPAEHVEEHQGWRLRWLSGITRRGNSVWTGAAASGAFAPRIEHAERFYRERGTTASFHLSPLAPSGLDALLDERGYVVDAPVCVQAASLARVLASSASTSPIFEVQVSSVLTPAWFELAGSRSRFAAAQATYRGLLERLGERARYALATSAGRPVGTSLGVLDGEWLGLSSMLTQPPFRGRGVAGALLRALCDDARLAGASRVYLQVERDNVAALRAYARAGLETAYTTHYRAQRASLQLLALRSS